MISEVCKGAQYRGEVDGQIVTVLDVCEDTRNGQTITRVVIEDNKGQQWSTTLDHFRRLLLVPIVPKVQQD